LGPFMFIAARVAPVLETCHSEERSDEESAVRSSDPRNCRSRSARDGPSEAWRVPQFPCLLRPDFHLRPGSPLRIQGESLGQFEYLFTYFGENSAVGALLQHLGNPMSHLAHLAFFHSPSGERGCSNANSARLHGRVSVEWNSILIDRNSGFSQCLFSFAAQHALGEDIDQHQVCVSTS